MLLSLLPQACGQSATVQFTVGLAVYSGTATRQNDSDSWIITNATPYGLLAGLTPPLDPPIIYVHSGLLDALL